MTETPRLSPTAAWALALVATATMSISYVDRQTLAVLAPSICASLHITEFWYSALVAAFGVAYLVGAPLAGRLIDALGARRGLLAAVLAWSVVAALHALVPTLAALFALRIALGLAESPSFPGAAQTIHRALPPESRARAFGMLFTGSSFGAMLAPLVAVGVATRYGWRSACLVTAVVGLVWVPAWLAVAFTRRARPVLDRPADEPDTVVVEDTAGYRAPGLALRPNAPLGARELFTHRAVLRATLPVVAGAPAVMFVLNWGSKYLVRDYHLTQRDVARYLWLPPLLFDVGAIAFGDAAARAIRARAGTHRRDAPDRGLLALAALMTACTAAMPFAPTPATTMALASVALAGGAGLYVLTTVDLLARVPAGATAAAGGACAAAQSLAQIIAAPLIGQGVAVLHSYKWIAVALGAWALPLCVVWIAWTPPPRVALSASAHRSA